VSTDMEPTTSSTKVGADSSTKGRKSTRPGKEVESGDRKNPFGLVMGMALFATLMAAPLIWMLSTSFKSTNEMANRDLNVLPRNPTTEGFTSILGADQTPVLRWFFNSMLAATLHTILVLVVCSLAAYALARLDFPGKKFLTAIILATIFVPAISLIIPSYNIVDSLGWLDTMTAIIVPGAAGAFGVFFLRQFFLQLPKELEEAAFLDGANRWQVFFRVILPLSKPALATLGLLSFLTNWNDFLWPLYVLFSPENRTLQAGLATLQSANSVRWDLLMAGAMVASVPVLLLFMVAQRYVIEGVSRSGVKG